MRNKIRHDSPLYQYDPQALWYIINSCLGTSPRQLVSTFYAAGGPGGRYDPEDFMEYLDRTYKDPNTASRAAEELRRMRQQDRVPFASFLPRFEQALSNAGGASWPDTAKITFLKGAINTELARSLVVAKLPEDYSSWVQEIQRIASNLENLHDGERAESWRRPRGRHDKAVPTTRVDADGDVMMAKLNSKPARQRQNRRKSSSPSQEDLRTCYQCGQEGHLARGCLSKGKINTPRRERRIARTAPRERSRSATPSTEASDNERQLKD